MGATARLALFVLAVAAAPASEVPSRRIVAATIEPPVRASVASADPVFGDTWTCAWTRWGSGDGDLLTIVCDTHGFGDAVRSTRGRNVLLASFAATRPPALVGTDVATSGDANLAYGVENDKGDDGATWKGYGLTCVDDVLVLAVARQGYAVGPHRATLVRDCSLIASRDRGASWSAWPARRAQPLAAPPTFAGGAFACPFFADVGRDGDEPPACARGRVYAVSNDGAWNNGGLVRLGRVPRARLAALDASDWSWWRGGDGGDDAAWGPLADARPLIEAPGRCSQTRMTWIRALDRWVMPLWWYPEPGEPPAPWNASHTTWELYEAPAPWGPWTRVATRDWRTGGWYDPSIPAKFIDGDGRGCWALCTGDFTTWGAAPAERLYTLHAARIRFTLADE